MSARCRVQWRVIAGGVVLACAILAALATLAPTRAPAQQGGGPGGEQGANQGEQGGEQTDEPREPRRAQARLKLKLKGLSGGKLVAGRRVKAVARVTPFVPGQRITLRLTRKGKAVMKRTKRLRAAKVGDAGVAKLRSRKLVRPGSYRVRAQKGRTARQAGARARSPKFKLRYPDLDPGDSGDSVALFNELLRKRGYYNTDIRRYGSHTERAVMAFRKVNRMARNFQATPAIFKRLAAGKGSFKLRHPGAGRHVEVDLARQVMVLADEGKPKHTFHVSTGTAATPSDRGGYRFYRRDPGYNAIGMYYSVYYNRGEAIHGYKSVPPYPASHGCIRNPIPDSRFIYDWVRLGMRIWVY